MLRNLGRGRKRKALIMADEEAYRGTSELLKFVERIHSEGDGLVSLAK